jgi:hypothetical protein
MRPRPPRLALWIILLVLGVATLLGEFFLFRLGLGADALGVPVLTVGAGLAYLLWAAPATDRRAAPTEEPFDDPVEEALRPEPSVGAATATTPETTLVPEASAAPEPAGPPAT